MIDNKKQQEKTPETRRRSFGIKHITANSVVNLKKMSRLDLIIIVITIVIITSSIIGFLYFKASKDQSDKTSGITFNLSEKTKNEILEAEKEANLGDYELAQKQLDEVAKSQTSNIDRSYVHIKQTVLASNNTRFDDALGYAKKAEDAYPTRLSAINYARAAENAKNRSLALKYYKLVIERTTEQEKSLSIEDYEYYQSKVKEFTN